jgi:hypothetical protein
MKAETYYLIKIGSNQLFIYAQMFKKKLWNKVNKFLKYYMKPLKIYVLSIKYFFVKKKHELSEIFYIELMIIIKILQS